jgi:alcohol dehydrogenase class IV
MSEPLRFLHESLPQRVAFGSGQGRELIGRELERLGAERVMLICSERERAAAAVLTAELPIAVRHHEVVMHVPARVAERARVVAVAHDADALVCVGGGSTTGLAKAIALTSGLPIVAVPTTYAGSEATNVWGLTEGSRKTTGVDPVVLPRAVVYDADLTRSLPMDLSVASGLNALAHCVDSMWAPNANPINRTLGAEAIRALAVGLPAVSAAPGELDGREQTLYAAYLSAVTFAAAGSGLHHKICHTLGGKYNLPHAQTHAVVLPYVLAFNGPAAPEAEARIAQAFGSQTALAGLTALRRTLDAPRALADYGFMESHIPAAAAAILPSVPASNPRPVTAADLEALLHAAWGGDDPSTLAAA